MKLLLKRIALKPNYTIGKLYVDGVYVCDTLEDTVRDLNKNGRFDNGEEKVYGKTAIPYGTYSITMNVKSPKFSNFSRYSWAKKYDGYLPRLEKVPNFDGVAIHPGNTHEDTFGCVLVGQNKEVGKVLYSVATFNELMDKYLVPAKNRNESITITIV